MTCRRLIVMRHAKAEPFAANDHDRELTNRGRADAAEAGAYLAAIEATPDHVVASPAARTRATWDEVAAALGVDLQPVLDDAVYNGSGGVVVESLQQVPEAAGTVLFVGHNPAAAYVVHLLDDGKGDADASDEMARGFPAAALAVLDIDGPWASLGEASGRLTHFHVGAG